jgi:anti-sigma factor RsiW
MNCSEIRQLVHPYFDGELDLELCARINAHLFGCKGCSQELANLQTLRVALRTPELSWDLPAGLEKRILKNIRKDRSFGQGSWNFFPAFRVLGGATAILALLFTLGVFLRHQGGPAGTDGEFAQEVVSEHLRAIMSGELIQVASSDQHTVKPWFNGKVDFSPDVKDLASDGFSLYGGRVDYLAGRPVAAIVFQRRKHWINLFVWPDADPTLTGQNSFSLKGFYIFRWAKDGLAYWTISDLNPAELGQFVALYRK